jgi:hypothetical protein
MVRPTEPGDDDTGVLNERNDDATGGESADDSLERRSYLKLAGVAAAGTVLGAAGTASGEKNVIQKDGYEIWEISGTEVYQLSDGETFENVLIDQSEPGANFYLSAANNPTGWTIRNVGWKGLGTVEDVSGWGGLFHMTVSGDGLIENVFIDNRDADRDTEIGGALLPQHHAGTVTCRNTFIAGCGNNAFYGSNPAKSGGNEGTVEFYNCYHRDNTVSQFRIGAPGCLVQNCVGVVDDPEQTRGTYPNTDSRRARGVWTRNMPGNQVQNSVMHVSADDPDAWANYMVDCISKSNSTEAVKNLDSAKGNADAPLLTREVSNGYTAKIVGDVQTSDLSVNVIGDGGVPMDPVMAAKGNRKMPPELPSSDGSSGGSGPNLDRTLTVDGRDAGRTDYSFTVSGEIQNNPDVGSFNTDDSASGSTASGFVNGGVDGYQFTGDITDATVDGDATIRVDGQAVDPGTLGSDADPSVTTGDATNVADTSMTLNGTLDDAGGASSVDPAFQYRRTGDSNWSSVTTQTLNASGGFSADVTGLAADTEYEYRAVADASDGDSATGATATVTTASGTTLDRTLTVDGRDAGRTDYSFTVSGEIQNNPDVGSFNTDDSASGSTASGFVNGGVDGYQFTGDITDATVDGDATIRVDGQAVDPDDLVLANKLVIDGRNTDGEATYDFTVTGRLTTDPELGASESADELADSRATGTVSDDRDGFRFSGDLNSLVVDGNADITFEDNDG